MGRRFHGRRIEPEEGRHRVNRRIRASFIRVIDHDGEQLGVMTPDDARERAATVGLDLVEVAPNARPPVCKIMDYGKFKYQEAKKASASSSRSSELKTVQFRPKTDGHDLETKLKRARKFLERGDKVKMVMRMRGREQAHHDRWIDMMMKYVEGLSDVGRLGSRPSPQGRTITLMIEPVPTAGKDEEASEDAPAEGSES